MKNKTIVITGSTSGIGKELVEIFSKSNTVFAGFRNENLIKQKENVQHFYIDMKNRQSIADAAEFIKSKTDKIDILINVAGCVVAGPVEFLDTDNIREQFEVNTFSHLDFTQKLLPIMENSRIINISSMASYGVFPFVSPYCASKRALDILFNTLAIETHKNIKVISIKPGVICTPLWNKSIDGNSEILEKCSEYSKELEFLKANALKNNQKGLKVEEVAGFIAKVAEIKNPKLSYNVGLDAKFAHLLSLLPQDLISWVVKYGLNTRMKSR